MHWNNIFHDYALVKASRDLIFGMYTQMTARNNIRYIHLHSFVTKVHKRSQEVTKRSPEVKKLEAPHRELSFCMYTHFYISNYIMHENLFLEVIEGHMRSQKVQTWFMLNPWKFAANHILVITTTKPISCVYNLILMTNIHAKNNLPGCYGYGVIEEWNFKLRVKNTFWASVTSNELQWPRGTNFHALCNYLRKNE